jgi:TetR/AcrR family transcriptional regulator
MAAGGRTPPSGRAGRAGRDEAAGAARIAPLYKRLPHGPHRLDRKEVLRHQRVRIHGALVEAVAQSGYEGTSVKQVIGLAGVSRRSFYEQFANKQECFLATFDLLAGRGVQRMSRAYVAAGGGLEDRLRAAFAEFATVASTDRKATTLVVVESQRAGSAGLQRLCRATATCEQLLARSFVESPEAQELPKPVVRGIAGGLHGAMSSSLREQGGSPDQELAEQMLRWTLLFQSPAAEQMAGRIADRVAEAVRTAAPAEGPGRLGIVANGQDERARLLHHVLRLAVLEDYRELTAPQIAEEAGVAIDAFFELFADRDECFLAALAAVGDELLGIAADPDLVCSGWPGAVRRVIGELMGFLATNPLYARALSQEAFAAGERAVERNLELAHGIATLLTEGAPGGRGSAMCVAGVAGAIWHTVRCHAASGRIELLPAFSDYLAYVVLAPFIGAEAAAETLAEDRAA